MASHFSGHHPGPKRLMQAAVIGQTGVDLFFVSSGFLITRMLLLSKDAPHFFKTFYIRRSLRISPLYYAFLALFFLVLPTVFGEPIPPFRGQWWAWCYLQNVPETFPGLTNNGPNHYWSLAVEEHFYLIWPLLVSLLSRRHFTALIYVTLLAPLPLRHLMFSHGMSVFYFTLTRFDALGYGALLAVPFPLRDGTRLTRPNTRAPKLLCSGRLSWVPRTSTRSPTKSATGTSTGGCGSKPWP